MYAWHTNQITDRIIGWQCACFQQQQERRFDFCFRDRRSQMQHADVLVIRTFGTLSQQSIIRLPESRGREQLISVAIGGKGSWLAHQRPDNMLVIDVVLMLATHARQSQGECTSHE